MRNEMSDEDRVARVREALSADPDVGPQARRIRVRPGDPWRIEGEVQSIAARRKAVRVARKALPGEVVEDAVRLDPEIRRSDEGLAEAVREAMRAEPAFSAIPVIEPGARPPAADKPWIGVMVHDGVVHLGGRLDPAGRSLAEALAWETASCRDVVNLITQEQKSKGYDEEIASAIRTLVGEHTELFGQQLRVHSSHGEVTLEGELRSAQQRGIAVGLCWLIPEVREVRDHTRVPGEPS